MAINLSQDFIGINNVLNENLSRFTSYRIIGFNQTENRPIYVTPPIKEGFYYKAVKNPRTGEVRETLKIVPLDNNINDLLRTAKMFELGDDEGNFLRFRFTTEKEPNPPSYQWVFIVSPSMEDTSPII